MSSCVSLLPHQVEAVMQQSLTMKSRGGFVVELLQLHCWQVLNLRVACAFFSCVGYNLYAVYVILMFANFLSSDILNTLLYIYVCYNTEGNTKCSRVYKNNMSETNVCRYVHRYSLLCKEQIII